MGRAPHHGDRTPKAELHIDHEHAAGVSWRGAKAEISDDVRAYALPGNVASR
jgi:hypothetical protein